MEAIERFQRILDYIDTQNICDEITEFLSEDELHDFCNVLEDNYNIEYEEFDFVNDNY